MNETNISTQAVDLLAKLMSEENVTVVRKAARTASFDLINRVLTIPTFVDMDKDEEFLMAFHEVGHALYTDLKGYEEIAERADTEGLKGFAGFMNIVEDARIEKMIQTAYPGARKHFIAGYKKLTEREFFGDPSGFQSLGFADRFNLYFKIGIRSGVRFSDEERVLLAEGERLETLADVEALARKMYDLARKEKKEQLVLKEKMVKTNTDQEPEEESEDDEFIPGSEEESNDDDEFGDSGADEFEKTEEQESTGSADSDGQDSEEESAEEEASSSSEELNTESEQEKSEGISSIGSESSSQEDLIPDAPVTQDMFDKEKNNYTIDESEKFLPSLTISPTMPNFRNRVFSYKEILSDCASIDVDSIGSFKKLREECRPLVNHLVKEFEMRKAAARYARTTTAKTGSLNTARLSQYLTSSNLFKTVSVIPDDKNHGFVLLLDWSASMMDKFFSVMKQLYILTSFCRKTGIPFSVYAFSDRWNTNIHRQKIGTGQGNTFGTKDITNNHGSFLILNFLDSKMNNQEFDRVFALMYSTRIFNVSNKETGISYKMGGTPLKQALLWVYHSLDKILARFGVEKATLITLTDGVAGRIYKTTDTDANEHRETRRFFIRCDKTGRIFLSEVGQEHIPIMQMIKNAYPGLKTVGFYALPEHGRGGAKNKAISTGIHIYSKGSEYNYQKHYERTQEIIKRIKKEGFYQFRTPGYDSLYFLDAIGSDIALNLNDVDEKMTAHKISKIVTSSAEKSNQAKLVLTKFMETVS
jgi:hypothetical protein